MGAADAASCSASGAGTRVGRAHRNWIWRSRIANYERHARILRRWMVTLLAEWGETSAKKLFRIHDGGRDGTLRARFDHSVEQLLRTLERTTLTENLLERS